MIHEARQSQNANGACQAPPRQTTTPMGDRQCKRYHKIGIPARAAIACWPDGGSR